MSLGEAGLAMLPLAGAFALAAASSLRRRRRFLKESRIVEGRVTAFRESRLPGRGLTSPVFLIDVEANGHVWTVASTRMRARKYKTEPFARILVSPEDTGTDITLDAQFQDNLDRIAGESSEAAQKVELIRRQTAQLDADVRQLNDMVQTFHADDLPALEEETPSLVPVVVLLLLAAASLAGGILLILREVRMY